jgi:hypothetical protein
MHVANTQHTQTYLQIAAIHTTHTSSQLCVLSEQKLNKVNTTGLYPSDCDSQDVMTLNLSKVIFTSLDFLKHPN